MLLAQQQKGAGQLEGRDICSAKVPVDDESHVNNGNPWSSTRSNLLNYHVAYA